MAQTFETRTDPGAAGLPAAATKSAASWSAIIAGAFVAASVTLILVALGSGLGFAAVSPWPNHGASATTFAVTTAIWLIIMQWLSAGLGGYIAGRLRTRWIGTHTHEVFFRDTAHGLVTWAVSTVLVAAVLASSISSMVGGGLHAASDVAGAGARGAMTGASMSGADDGMPGGAMHRGGPLDNGAYGLDKLFRTAGGGGNSAAGGANAAGDARDLRAQAAHIVGNALAKGGMPDADRGYLADMVAAQTGISQADAQKRVDDFVAAAMDAQMKVKAAADAARKAAAEAAIFLALSMLVGAFIASVAAVLGGRERDLHP